MAAQVKEITEYWKAAEIKYIKMIPPLLSNKYETNWPNHGILVYEIFFWLYVSMFCYCTS